MELFERGKEYAKNSQSFRGLSALLIDLLRKHLDSQGEYYETRLKIGTELTPKGSGAYRIVTITGKLVAQYRTATADVDDPTAGWVNWDVYVTDKGRWCAVRENWTLELVGNAEEVLGDREYWIVDSMDELRKIKNRHGKDVFPSSLGEVVEDAAKDEQMGGIKL